MSTAGNPSCTFFSPISKTLDYNTTRPDCRGERLYAKYLKQTKNPINPQFFSNLMVLRKPCKVTKEKNDRFPFLDILRYLKNTNKNPKFGRVRQVPTRELGWEFPGWDLSHFAKFGILVGIL